jgi:pyruvate,water dikinase
MTSIRLPVPEGYVVTTKAFNEFLETNHIKTEIDKLIAACDVEHTDRLMETSDRIKQLILSKLYPPSIKNELTEAYKELSYSNQIFSQKALELIATGRELAIVAVRSSATAEDLPTASFAGQQASFLNVKGMQEYLDAVKNCWASLYEPRAIFYRAKQKFKNASIAVVVQRMVNSEKSGVMFTVNPSTGEDNIIVEACWGLGESLVSGAVHPDNYTVSKQGKILAKKIGLKKMRKIRDLATDRTIDLPVPKDKINAQVLTDDEIVRIAQLGMILEEHYGKPQDVEFGIERDRIYVLQTRAVTTTGKVTQEKEISGEIIIKGLGVSPGIVSGVVRIVHGREDIVKVKPGDILVTKMTSPDLVPTMSKSAAIITDLGGQTCHAAIVSREMGIPCIVGTHEATAKLKDGQSITIDAYRGIVYEGAVGVPKSIAAAEAHEVEISETFEPTKTKIKVNLVFPRELEKITKVTDGVGLLRIEHMITQSGIHPAKLIREGRTEEYIKILTDGIRPIATAFNPKPVWVRTLDARSDEFRNLQGGDQEPHEDNPMLGWHGIRRSLDEPELLKAEFEAVKRLHEEGLRNVHIMIPFIINVAEFVRSKELAKEVGLSDSCKLGIMVETPACALTIEDFCKAGIQFVSFGTNDLSQLTLGIDRNNDRIAKLFSELHGAVERMIYFVIKTCKQYGVESSVCGEAPSNKPEFVEFLVRSGIDSISCNIDAITKVREKVAQVEKQLTNQ